MNEFEHGQLGKSKETGQTFLSMGASEEHHFQRPYGPTEEKKAKQVTALKREFWLDNEGKLNYKVYLGVDGAPLKHHLSAQLTR